MVKLISHKNEVLKNLNEGLKKGLTDACFIVEADAKRMAPVDTGHLRASISNRTEFTEDKLTGQIGFKDEWGNWVHYAPFQEFGTSRNAPHPFLFPAAEANKRQIVEALKQPSMKGSTSFGIPGESELWTVFEEIL